MSDKSVKVLVVGGQAELRKALQKLISSEALDDSIELVDNMELIGESDNTFEIKPVPEFKYEVELKKHSRHEYPFWHKGYR